MTTALVSNKKIVYVTHLAIVFGDIVFYIVLTNRAPADTLWKQRYMYLILLILTFF